MRGLRRAAAAGVAGVLGAVAGVMAARGGSEPAAAPLRVAVTEADIESIVRAVGGPDVQTFHLFRGCILRRDLEVERAVAEKLADADAIVWTGFFNESRAVYAWLERLPAGRREGLRPPVWIDVSRDAARVNVPTSSCDSYVELQFMPGDPFFWLNPENGAVIAGNVASGLARIRPDRRRAYEANAQAFAADLAQRIAAWKTELAAVSQLKVFSAQCGWQNFTRLGGPRIMACRATPGQLAPPERLALQLGALDLDVILVDPNTPLEYGEAFRRHTRARVVEVASSIADLPPGATYFTLFENLLRALRPGPSGQ